MDRKLVLEFVRVTEAAAMGAAIWVAQALVFDTLFQAQGFRWGALAALIALGAMVFAVAALALRATDPGELKAYLRRHR